MLPTAAAHPNPPRILVVEDEVLIRMLVSDELRDAGALVVEAASAQEALACLQSGPTVDLVFSDIHMPGPTNGIDLARHIRKEFPNLPVILTSGNPGPAGAESLATLVRKPYNVTTIIALMFTLLNREAPP